MRTPSEVVEFLKRAQAYCAEEKLRLTDGRIAVLEQVASSRRPVKAYDVLQAISPDKGRQMPPVVYRALDFWTAHGFIHRIDSLNAYTACTHPGCGHECQIFICSQCGRVSEICDESLETQVRKNAAQLGFMVEHLRVEASGRCPDCC